MQNGEGSEGQSWYNKAITLGFKPEVYESEIKSIYLNASYQNKNEIANTLNMNDFNFK